LTKQQHWAQSGTFGVALMLLNQRNRGTPPVLRGPALFEANGLPRFWPAVWSSFFPGHLAQSTLKKQLAALERFYVFTDELFGSGELDAALAAFDVVLIGHALEAYFLSLRNNPCLGPSSEDSWQTMLRFLREILTRMARSGSSLPFQHELQARLMRLEGVDGQLHVSKRRRVERVRSLPAAVIESLYELLDPSAPGNPFRKGDARWRAYIIFILLLHQGLRRGELLCLAANCIKSEFDRTVQRERFWLTVRFNQYEADPRWSTPSIKTPDSFRQLPLSEHTVRLVEEYTANYRGKPQHSFLINSQKSLPMSTENVTRLFRKITAALPKSAKRVLEDRYGRASITPHDLRHTCAVLRLNQLLNVGVSMEEAMQQLRSFFGWARASNEPLRYARTVFEDRLASIWKTEFDERIEVLRHLART
jgi:integrase